mmetsp:Transcript_41364/g.106671  ORF Transcript_41364/g.106671 Transcript_41364/m.106671 type:complete len:297 (-) Transcript_41364:15-905(-)
MMLPVPRRLRCLRPLRWHWRRCRQQGGRRRHGMLRCPQSSASAPVVPAVVAAWPRAPAPAAPAPAAPAASAKAEVGGSAKREQKKPDGRVTPKTRQQNQPGRGARAGPMVPELFPVVFVADANTTTIKKIVEDITFMFRDAHAKIVDLVALQQYKGKQDMRGQLILILASLPRSLNVVALTIPRRVRGMMRIRLIRDFTLNPDADPEVLEVTKDSQPMLLSLAMKNKMIPPKDAPDKAVTRTLTLKAQGEKAAGIAMASIDELFGQTKGEIAFSCQFADRQKLSAVGGYEVTLILA